MGKYTRKKNRKKREKTHSLVSLRRNINAAKIVFDSIKPLAINARKQIKNTSPIRDGYKQVNVSNKTNIWVPVKASSKQVKDAVENAKKNEKKSTNCDKKNSNCVISGGRKKKSPRTQKNLKGGSLLASIQSNILPLGILTLNNRLTKKNIKKNIKKFTKRLKF